jgi:hypothetical protein
VLVVEAGCVGRVSLQFFRNERRECTAHNQPPLTDSRLDFIDVLLTDFELETQIEDSNKGTEMFIIALIGKAISKDSGGDEQ